MLSYSIHIRYSFIFYIIHYVMRCLFLLLQCCIFKFLKDFCWTNCFTQMLQCTRVVQMVVFWPQSRVFNVFGVVFNTGCYLVWNDRSGFALVWSGTTVATLIKRRREREAGEIVSLTIKMIHNPHTLHVYTPHSLQTYLIAVSSNGKL